MLSCCCPSVVYLDRRGEQRFYEASKPVSSHGLLLERTQKVPTGNVGSQPFSISIDAAALFSINNVTVLGLTFGFRNYTIGLRLLCLVAASICLLPYLASRTKGLSVWSRVAPRAMSDSSVSYESSPSKDKRSWAHQNLQVAPALPILDVSADHIFAVLNGTTLGSTNSNPNSTSRMHHRQIEPFDHHVFGHADITPSMLNPLSKRAGAEPCSVGKPCADDSCCSSGGKCGYGPDYCGSGCSSNCNATAMCGRYSEGGDLKCGMKLCCSYYGWCGTDELHCGNPDPNGKAPCQKDFGLCKIIPSPSCDAGGNSAGKRTIGYYQASNTRDRRCDRVAPSQINTKGLTHLFFAFAEVDPKDFAVVPGNDGDVPQYKEFTKLQSSSLKTWIAIGGFDFSDPGPTHTTWSDLCSTQGNRAAFISSLEKFMSQYGFQGVDIDWEYPGTPQRGGKRADTANFVSLVKEMKAAFGGQYGISVTLAPDYWYLRGFDAKAMEDHVDMFGFMAYDLHGSWDADIKTLGSKVRGQADTREIYNDTLPLWFDGLNPAKINMGLAYYGRGYTLADPSCNDLNCPFAGPSLPGPCTNFHGVLSLAEIKSYIAQKGLKPKLLKEAMMKQITWEDQWIGYDDSETTAMKKKWASGYCFGGTMIWSVDFETGSGSNDANPDNNAPVTHDGKCGPKNGGTICGNWKDGGCCSSAGFCGSGPDHCGAGCQSGDCLMGGQTTDGSCGPLHGNSICGSWTKGACCSSSGFCGSDEGYCGESCISGPCDSSTHDSGPSGDVYLDPSIWSSGQQPIINCIPPCVYIFPPLSLESTTTITFPLFTTSLEVAWSTTKVTTLKNGQVSTSTGIERTTKTTVLTIPPVTTNEINLWNVPISSGVTSALVQLTSSILPPPFTITDDPNPRSESGVSHPRAVRTITPPPFPYSNDAPSADGSSPNSNAPSPPSLALTASTITGLPFTFHSEGSSITRLPFVLPGGSSTITRLPFVLPPETSSPSTITGLPFSLPSGSSSITRLPFVLPGGSSTITRLPFVLPPETLSPSTITGLPFNLPSGSSSITRLPFVLPGGSSTITRLPFVLPPEALGPSSSASLPFITPSGPSDSFTITQLPFVLPGSSSTITQLPFVLPPDFSSASTTTPLSPMFPPESSTVTQLPFVLSSGSSSTTITRLPFALPSGSSTITRLPFIFHPSGPSTTTPLTPFHPPEPFTITRLPFVFDPHGPGSTTTPVILPPSKTGGSMTHHSGKPKSKCKKGCGHKCSGLFCIHLCLLDCGGFSLPGIAAPDPVDPNPPPGPPGGNPPGGDHGSNEPTSNEPTSTGECTKSVVTDYWVSCSSVSGSSSSCKTTSTSLVRGCDITATTTTTGGSCPIVTLDPNEDEGEDGPMGKATSTKPPETKPTSAAITNIDNCVVRLPGGSNPRVHGAAMPRPIPSFSSIPNCTPKPTSTGPPASTIYFIGHFAASNGPGAQQAANVVSNWAIFHQDDGKLDPCGGKPVWKGEFTEMTPKFPIHAEWDQCKFDKAESSVGTLDCGGTVIKCADDNNGKDDFFGGDSTSCGGMQSRVWWPYLKCQAGG